MVKERNDKKRWVKMKVKNVSKKDSGEYNCVEKSGGGVDERKVKMLVK